MAKKPVPVKKSEIIDGTLKRSGYFDNGEPVGEWTTYDEQGNVYKVGRKKVTGTVTNNVGKSEENK